MINAFFEETNLPMINRIGLRYIDHCPLIKRDSRTLGIWYDSKLPYQEFEIADAETMSFQIKAKMDSYYLGYAEAIAKIEDKDWLILDLDGSARNINASSCIEITDKLHELIAREYAKTIRGKEGPLYRYMKTGVID